MSYEAYDKFERFKRPEGMAIKDYVYEFERLLSKTQSYGTSISGDVQAYRLLKSANISESHQQLARATILGDLTYEKMKDQLTKILGDVAVSSAGDASDSLLDIKTEIVNEATLHEADEQWEDTYYGATRGRNNGWRWPHGGRGGYVGNIRGSSASASGYSPKNYGRPAYRGATKRGKNPLGKNGQVTRCAICGSVNHWAVSCPDVQYFQETSGETYEDYEHQVTLYQSHLLTDESMKIFVAESFSCAILDSGATATVAGETWMNCYIDSLPSDKKKKVSYAQSCNTFKFGSGNLFKSMYKVKVPANIGSKEVYIETDVVQTDVPLLLSRSAMKKANTFINFKEDSVSMLGEKQNIVVTSSGHYSLPLTDRHSALNDIHDKNSKIALKVDSDCDLVKIAEKLHSQFSHPPAHRLIKLVKNSNWPEKDKLISLIRIVSADCRTCKEYKVTPPRPVVGLNMATEFNEVVAMDLKFFEGKIILHLIDHLSRFSAATLIPSKKPEVVIDAIFDIWIKVFGPPKKYFSDNGGEFNNSEFRDLCEAMNIVIKTTAAEAPWSNGLCERHNAVLAEMLNKTMSEGKFSLKVALNWSIHAKNSLCNVHGFSPFQLAIGYTPALPSVLNNKLPALEERTVSEYLEKNLRAMASARKAFVEAENSERIRRALRHNIRPSSNNKYYTGDQVFFKRNDVRKWQGPGTVIGQDSQQVLVKHGGVYIRVHPCRLMLDDPSHESRDEIVSENEDRLNLIKDATQLSHGNEQSYQETIASSDEDTEIVAMEDEQNSSSMINGVNNPLHNTTDPVLEKTVIEDGNTLVRNLHTGAGGRPTPQPRKNTYVRYRTHDADQWIEGKVLSRSGKATGKYKNNWNVENTDGKIVDLNFEKDIDVWEYSETDVEEINLCNVFTSELDNEKERAKHNELQNWINENVYEEVDDVGQETISVRWVITPKVIEGKWSTKARLVARGFEEDSSLIRTDSPTCMRETLRIVLAYAVCRHWEINSIDIKAAFLQGKPIEREVYLRPPKEANSANKVWKLKKVVYGLSDASRVWYLRVVDELHKLGTESSQYDKAFFMWKKDGVVEGLIVVHVDDFLWTGSGLFFENVICPLKSVFKISKECGSSFKYIGIHISKENESIRLDQGQYIDSIVELEVDNKSKDSLLDKEQKKKFRGLVGQINWASGITRPDISFSACQISTVQSNPKVLDAVAANKSLADLKREKLSIRYVPLDRESLKLVVFADASYANLTDGGSQGGHIIFLADGTQRAVPLAWSSKRIKRVVRSTLSAETLSTVDALDTAHLVMSMLKEVVGKQIPIELYTDNKSLYDSVSTTNYVLDKRLRVEMSSLRECYETGEVRFKWIETNGQVADVLTKRGASKAKLFHSLRENRLDLE